MLARKVRLAVQKQHHFYAGNHLHFITASTYRRVRLFDSPRFRKRFIDTLGQLRNELDFRLVGYVVMPDHFHLLIWPGKDYNPSNIVGSRLASVELAILPSERYKCSGYGPNLMNPYADMPTPHVCATRQLAAERNTCDIGVP